MLEFFFSFTGKALGTLPFEGIFFSGILSHGSLYLQPEMLEGISSWGVLRLTQGGVP